MIKVLIIILFLALCSWFAYEAKIAPIKNDDYDK